MDGGPERGPFPCRKCDSSGVIEGVRLLTDAEIAKEVNDIETRPWVLGDVLFVKQFYADFQNGNIYKVDGKIVPTVVETPYIDANDPKHVFATLEDMVRAGWIPD